MLEEFLDTNTSLFADDYLVLKIDIEKMQHGDETGKRLRGDRTGGIPWITILDANGTELVTSAKVRCCFRCRLSHRICLDRRESSERLLALEGVRDQVC